MSATNLITITDIKKIYSSGRIGLTALDSINIEIEQGCFLGITGPSGSGKSTLMNLLGGLDTPSTGRIIVSGKDIASMTKRELAQFRRRRVGMIFQSFNLISSYTAIGNVALPLLFEGIDRNQRNSRAEIVLKKVGLENRKHHKPSELSGGEQQRVAIARALVNQPSILLADEPTGNLDSETSRNIVTSLAQLNREDGLTVIMISHEHELLGDFCTEIVSLKDGRVHDYKKLK